MVAGSQGSSPLSDHARRVLEAAGGRDTSAVLSSWRRCLKLHSLDPDLKGAPSRRDEAEIAAARRREAPLIETAGPYMDQLFAILRDGDFSVLLTDATGIVLAVRTAGTHDFWERSVERWTGSDLAEHVEGTNAGGTCLIEKRPITIHDGEHFYARNAGIVSSGTPIFGANADVIGAIDVVRPETRESATFGALILAAVVETARRIQLAVFARAYPCAHIAMASRERYHPGSVVAIDENGLVVGATRAARQRLGLDAARLATPFPFAQIDGAPLIEPTLAEVERRAAERALAIHKGNMSAAARSLGIGRNTLHRKLRAHRKRLED